MTYPQRSTKSEQPQLDVSWSISPPAIVVSSWKNIRKNLLFFYFFPFFHFFQSGSGSFDGCGLCVDSVRTSTWNEQHLWVFMCVHWMQPRYSHSTQCASTLAHRSANDEKQQTLAGKFFLICFLFFISFRERAEFLFWWMQIMRRPRAYSQMK